MPDWVVWVVVGVAVLAIIVALIVFIVKLAGMSAEDRKEAVVNFVMSLVTAAENYFIESKKGTEKLAMVEERFNQTAPWFLKILLKITGSVSLQDCIETALTRLKDTWNK